MKRMRKQADPLEQAMRTALRQKQQDDIVRQSLIFDGEEFLYAEKTTDVIWKVDPQSGELIPYSVSKTAYTLDDNGVPFGKITNVAVCKRGCKVRIDSIFICRKCKSNLCRKHAIFAGRRAYCRGGSCLVIGIIIKCFWGVYRLLRFCVMSVLGIQTDERDNSLEKELFDRR